MTIASDSLVSVQAYLRRRGWIEEPPGRAGSWWHRPSPRSPETHIGVPDRIGVPGRIIPGTVEWRSVIGSLADYEKRSFEEIAENVRDQFVDVTELCVASDFMIVRSIPLATGVDLLAAAKAMLRAAATAAVRPRADIAGSFSTVANRIANQSRLGHTREGSYVIPLLMPLTPLDDSARPAFSGMETHRVEYEPEERRVTRTLAQALDAMQQRIVAPDREPGVQDIVPLVAAGVTRELVAAVRSILAQPEVSDFSASFQWAGAIAPPGGVPRRVELPASAERLLTSTERILKSSRKGAGEIITGLIVMIRHLPDAPTGEIGIQTMRSGRTSEILVQLPAEEIDNAHAWMAERRAVVAEGQLIHKRGRPLRMPEPGGVHPVDETVLF
jgi:hypothetical protein